MSTTLHLLLREIIRPAVRASLRHGLGVRELLLAAKEVFVEEARAELARESRGINVSRISVLTGLQRREVGKLLDGPPTGEAPQNLLSRVVGQWQYDKRFSLRPGKGKVLEYDTAGHNFVSLVRSVTQDVHPGTVLSELERRGIISRKGSRFKLVARVFQLRDEPDSAFLQLGSELSDLVAAVEENLSGAAKIPNLHGRTEFTRIAAGALPRVRRWLLSEGSAFHARAREFLAEFDLDFCGERAKDSRSARVVLGTFGYCESGEK